MSLCALFLLVTHGRFGTIPNMRKFAASSILTAGLLFARISHAQMSSNDVATVIQQAASAAAVIGTNSVIAVLDREGFVLGVWQLGAGPVDDAAVAGAIGKAGAAAYLSSNGHAFTSRTAGFIVKQHFPPGIKNRPPGPLVGVNFSNLTFSDVNHFKKFTIRPTRPTVPLVEAAPVPVTGGLAGTPGGVPLYKSGRLVGGLGVAGAEIETLPEMELPNLNEIVALAGQRGFEPQKIILGSRVTIDGIRLAYVETSPESVNFAQRTNAGVAVPGYPIQSSPTVVYPRMVLGDVEGEVRQLIISDPIAGLIENQPRLTAAEVKTILGQAAARSQKTRAGIRLPAGRPAQVFITVVNKPDPGQPATVLGTFRTPDATLFSWDVAVQKARTALYFSSKTLALSTRAIGFLAQSALPPGIEDTAPGPLFGFQEKVSMFPLEVNPLNGAKVPQPTKMDPVLINGITIFPGGFPLYRNGVLIGAIGISGDGVDQDDLIGMSGAAGFLPPDEIRADRFEIRGARLPYVKFPRNPTL
jgi:uncharacterized protein GlcG (DUF336 family)